jgi:hypothetical protein
MSKLWVALQVHVRELGLVLVHVSANNALPLTLKKTKKQKQKQT